MKTGGLKWWWRKSAPRRSRPIVALMKCSWPCGWLQPKAEVVEKDQREEPLKDEMGNVVSVRVVYDVKVKTVETKGKVKVSPVPPDELLISRRHNSILLMIAVRMAHRHPPHAQMRDGYDVDDEDMALCRV